MMLFVPICDYPYEYLIYRDYPDAVVVYRTLEGWLLFSTRSEYVNWRRDNFSSVIEGHYDR